MDEVIVTKKIFIISMIFLIMIIIVYGSYQFREPVLTEQQAKSKAKMYLDTVNLQMHLSYDTKKDAESSSLNKDTFWNKIAGNRTWYVHIDGVLVILEADNGQFIAMIFPLDGVITRENYPDWF